MRISPEDVPGFRLLLVSLLLGFLAQAQSSFTPGQVLQQICGGVTDVGQLVRLSFPVKQVAR